jgi:hypothetical protein
MLFPSITITLNSFSNEINSWTKKSFSFEEKTKAY